jgi:aldehyde dehydrogenase (NAD+)
VAHRAAHACIREIDHFLEHLEQWLAPQPVTVPADAGLPAGSTGAVSEEIFGPVLPIIEVAGLDEAIAFINQRDKPLALYAFTGNESTRRRLVVETTSGALNFGLPIAHLRVPGLPFGGVGGSGTGSYHGRHSLETFSHRKAVLDVPLT